MKQATVSLQESAMQSADQQNDDQPVIVLAALYKFVPFDDYVAFRPVCKAKMLELNIRGSLLLASEGINGTISGTREDVDAFLAFLKSDPRFADLQHKESLFTKRPFNRSLVRLKKELISIGRPADPMHDVGTYVKPQDWNALISRDDVILLDSRNDYETYLGTFKGAIDPNIKNFRQLPDFIESKMEDLKGKKVATFCTGGIRCEKLTAWMKDSGFEDVYHLEGGILKYLEEIPQEESLWEGECYVFDQRVAVGHGLKASETATNCDGCGHCLLPEDRAHPEHIDNIQCAYCFEDKKVRKEQHIAKLDALRARYISSSNDE